MLCFGKSSSHNNRSTPRDGPPSPAPPPAVPQQEQPTGGGGSQTGLLLSNQGSGVAPSQESVDVLNMLEPGRFGQDLRKLLTSAGIRSTRADPNTVLVNLSMIPLDQGPATRFGSIMEEDEDPGSTAGGQISGDTAPSLRHCAAVGVGAGEGSSGLPQRCFVRLSSMAQHSSFHASLPSVLNAGTDSAGHLPGSVPPVADHPTHGGTDSAEPEPGSSRALNWTASRRALAVLVVREEHLSKHDKALGMLSHEKRLSERLDRLNLEVVVMAGDGNCQFRSLAHELLGNQDFHPHIRDKVISHIKRHKDEYECFLGEDFAAYVDSMSKPRTWGDELTLRAACDTFGVIINVVTSDADNWFLTYEPQTISANNSEVFLTYIAPIHFNCIRRTGRLRTLSKSLSSSFKRLANSGQLRGTRSLELQNGKSP